MRRFIVSKSRENLNFSNFSNLLLAKVLERKGFYFFCNFWNRSQMNEVAELFFRCFDQTISEIEGHDFGFVSLSGNRDRIIMTTANSKWLQIHFGDSYHERISILEDEFRIGSERFLLEIAGIGQSHLG